MTLYKVELLKNATIRKYDIEICDFEADSDEKAIEFAKAMKVLRNSFRFYLKKRRLRFFWKTIYKGWGI